jgi:YVTN family beta-propeller protein
MWSSGEAMLSRSTLCFWLFVLCSADWALARTQSAYVANIDSNTVSVISVSNNNVVATIPVGDGPWGVAVNPAGTFAYVVNNHDTALGDSVSVISTASKAVVATVKVQSVPFAAAVTPDGQYVYVTNANSNTVSVIQTSNNTVVATVPVGQYPVGIIVPSPGGFVYVANDVAGSVSVISTVTNTVVATIPVGANPIGMAATPDGLTVFAVDSGSNDVSVISPFTNTVTSTIPVAAGPFGGAVSPDGRYLYVANSSSNLVTIIDISTLSVDTTVAVGSSPLQLAFTSDSQYAYVTNIGSNNVSVIVTGSKAVVSTLAVGTAPIGAATTPAALVNTVAGGFVGDNGAATAAGLEAPYSIAQDKAGNLYVTDFLGHRLRKITLGGKITTFAGNGTSGYNGDNIPASSAMLSYPNGLVFDSVGNLLMADNNRVRKISPSGTITTIAGNGIFGYSGDGGPATLAELRQPFKLARDKAGNLYFTDIGNNVVRKVDGAGIITTIAGNGVAGFSGDGGPATQANLNLPRGIAVDGSGNVYIGDSVNKRVRKVDRRGIITTFAGNGLNGTSGDGGPATNAAIGQPQSLLVQAGVLYIGCGAARVRSVVISTGIINTFAGSSYGYDGDGHSLGTTQFTHPVPFFDSSGNFLVADGFNSRVRKAVNGVMTTIAGGHLGDGGKAISATLVLPESVRFDAGGNYYIAESTGNRIRRVNTSGTITTIAGIGSNGYTGDGGLATAAQLSNPNGVAVDGSGNIYISDTFNNVIRKVAAGIINTFATSSSFSSLMAMSVDSANNIYVADSGACVIWKITPTAVISVAAGVQFVCGYNGDNINATTADLNGPIGVSLDGQGNLYIADTNNNRVREVNSGGIITTIAGDGTCGFIDNVAATAGELCLPWDVAVAESGTLFIADESNLRIRQVVSGTISTYVGANTSAGYNGDGLIPLQTGLADPVGVAVSPRGTLYFVDDSEERVRQVR